MNPEVHKTDFLVNKKFKGFFPKNLLDSLTARLKFSDWEARVLEEYEKQSGKPEMIAQLLYLQVVRQWPIYGSTFFISCLSIPPRGFFEHRAETLYIAVNAEGITITDADKVVSTPFLSSPLSRIFLSCTCWCCWCFVFSPLVCLSFRRKFSTPSPTTRLSGTPPRTPLSSSTAPMKPCRS